MKDSGINFEFLAKLRGITVEQVRSEFEAAMVESRKESAAFLAANPAIREQFESDYQRDIAFRKERNLPIVEKDAFMNGCVLSHAIRNRAKEAKINAGDVAGACDGELPPGWDDMLPPAIVDPDIDRA